MNIETLNLRLKEIEGAIEQITARYNALMGNKSEVLHWIKSLESEFIQPAQTPLAPDSSIEVPVETAA